MATNVNKKIRRLRRARKVRANIALQSKPRLTVYRSLKHIYAQIILPKGKGVLVSASTLDKALKTVLKHKTGNIEAAKQVGILIANRAIKKLSTATVAFDRSGFEYSGRVKALADAAREAGLEF
jgi:large subunit ribosomal protein L18